MVALPTPFEAYRLDLGRAGTDAEFGSADSMWLLIAHCLGRFANQPETARLDLAERCAQALEQFATTEQDAVDLDGVEPLDPAARGDLARVIDGFRGYRARAGQEVLAQTVLDMSTQMSALGALTLAYTLVGNTREAVQLLSERSRGLLLAEQARLSRLLGHLDQSEVLYGQLHGIAERSCDEFLLARAAIGRGVIARVRGNYPTARVFFGEALALSERAGSAELQRLAHQGLFVVAAMGEAWEEALRHGWLALVLGAPNQQHEAEALINLAHVSLGAGFPRAALHAVLKAMPNAREQRMLLPALGTAVMAAARCNERVLLDSLSARMESAVATSSLPFEGADALLSLSRAYGELGLATRADSIRCRARAIAEEHGFHELVLKAEETVGVRAAAAEPRDLDEKTREVVSSLETLEYEFVL